MDPIVGIPGIIVNLPMVQYMLAFFMALGALALIVKGVNLVWDVTKTTWLALKSDVSMARAHDQSLLSLWKQRIRKQHPAASQHAG